MIRTHVTKQSPEVSMQKGKRPKHTSSTDQSIHATKQEATVSTQQGMRPKFKTSKEQSPAVCSEVLQYVVYKDPDNTNKQWYPATITSWCADKYCQSTQCEHMQPGS